MNDLDRIALDEQSELLDATLALINRAALLNPNEKRRAAFCKIVAALRHDTAPDTVEGLIEQLLDHPARRLAVYGTLAPGERNAAQLDGLVGTWREATVRGSIQRQHGLPYFTWNPAGPTLPIKVFSCPQLVEHWPRLDRFEGADYRRILVSVTLDGRLAICNIYEAAKAI